MATLLKQWPGEGTVAAEEPWAKGPFSGCSNGWEGGWSHSASLLCQGWTLQPSDHTAAPEGECWGWKEDASHQAVRHCTPQPSVHALRRLRVRSHRILAPESRGPHQRCGFREPRLLHLPTQRKAVNFLTWDIWFRFINSHLLTFWLFGLCGKHPCISWLPPSPFRTVSQSYLRRWVPGLSPQFCLPIKHNSQILGCDFFCLFQRMSQRSRYHQRCNSGFHWPGFMAQKSSSFLTFPQPPPMTWTSSSSLTPGAFSPFSFPSDASLQSSAEGEGQTFSSSHV